MLKNVRYSMIMLHFSSEEHLMAKYGYPGLKEHKKEHSEFKKKVLPMMSEFMDKHPYDIVPEADILVDYLKEMELLIPLPTVFHHEAWLLDLSLLLFLSSFFTFQEKSSHLQNFVIVL